MNRVSVKPLTHDPSRPAVVTGDIFGSRLDVRHDGHQDGCQKTTPVVTAVATAGHDGPCVRGFSDFERESERGGRTCTLVGAGRVEPNSSTQCIDSVLSTAQESVLLITFSR